MTAIIPTTPTATTTGTITRTEPTGGLAKVFNRLDDIWSGLCAADRVVLLGHDRDVLDSADKMRLAKVAAGQRKAARSRSVQSRVARG